MRAFAVTLLIATSNFQLATPFAAGEAVAAGAATPTVTAAAAPTKENATIDCSKEVWPNFSPSCLKNANRATAVRFVTANPR